MGQDPHRYGRRCLGICAVVIVKWPTSERRPSSVRPPTAPWARMQIRCVPFVHRSLACRWPIACSWSARVFRHRSRVQCGAPWDWIARAPASCWRRRRAGRPVDGYVRLWPMGSWQSSSCRPPGSGGRAARGDARSWELWLGAWLQRPQPHSRGLSRSNGWTRLPVTPRSGNCWTRRSPALIASETGWT